MTRRTPVLPLSELNKLHTAGAGFDVLRYVSLPELLGAEATTILYYMGRNLARSIDIGSMEDISLVFAQLGWGNLDLLKEKKNEMLFQLMSDAVVNRLQAPINAEFRLEAGFLAEAIQKITGDEYECLEEINNKLLLVQFSVVKTN